MTSNFFSFTIKACVLAVICSVHAETPLHNNEVSQTDSPNIAEKANSSGVGSQTEVPPNPSDANSEKTATETHIGKGESATNKLAEETQKDEVAAIVHDQVIDQVTIIMMLETLAFAVIVALLGWIAQHIVRQRLESEFDKNYKERLKVLEDRYYFLTKTAAAGQNTSQGYTLWVQYANAKEDQKEAARVFLNSAILLAQRAYEEASVALELVKDDPSALVLSYEAQNNLAYYLAERGIMRDAGHALSLAQKLYEGVEYFRKHISEENLWYELEETRAKVFLTYRLADARGQNETEDLTMAQAREREACGILEGLVGNEDIPEFWRRSIREQYRQHCPAL